MDAFTPLDQGNTSFTSPITDFNMNDWVTDADDWNTFYNFDALLSQVMNCIACLEDLGPMEEMGC